MEWYVERRFDANETLMSYDKPKLIAIINEFIDFHNKDEKPFEDIEEYIEEELIEQESDNDE